VFAMIAARYGGTNVVNRSRRAEDKIANGQCMFMTRAAHDEVGGHGAVRAKVAEDVALAQLFFRRGRRSEIVLGTQQLATRMYSSLGEMIRGWMKNIYAATGDAMPFGALGRALLPLALIATPVATLTPPLVLLASAFMAVPAGLTTWALVCTVLLLAWWTTVYVGAERLSPLYALTFPLGAAVVLYIIVRAILRGRRVEWKGRSYQAG
jgi:chlorobactene glucosyltransferase